MARMRMTSWSCSRGGRDVSASSTMRSSSIQPSASRDAASGTTVVAMARNAGRTATGPFRYGWFSRWMIASMEPPPKRRMRTFKIFVPSPPGAQPLTTLLPEFLKVRDQLAERVRQADGLDLGRNRVVSPVTRLLRLPLGAEFAFLLAHDRRHLWQARQVREGLS